MQQNTTGAERYQVTPTVTDTGGRQIMTDIIDLDGHSLLELNLSSLAEGYYVLAVQNRYCSSTVSFAVIR